MSVDWRRIELSREQIRAGELEKIRSQFSLFMMTNEPAGEIAVFTRRCKSGGCEVYFPPAALRFAEFVFERHAPGASRPPPAGTARHHFAGRQPRLGRHAARKVV